jgi:hypothetical protein
MLKRCGAERWATQLARAREHNPPAVISMPLSHCQGTFQLQDLQAVGAESSPNQMRLTMFNSSSPVVKGNIWLETMARHFVSTVCSQSRCGPNLSFLGPYRRPLPVLFFFQALRDLLQCVDRIQRLRIICALVKGCISDEEMS